MTSTGSSDVEVLRRTSSQSGWSHCWASHCTDSCGIWHSSFSQKKANSDTTCDLYRSRYYLDKPLPHANQGQENENKPFHKHGRESQTIRNSASSMKTDNLVSKICIEAHAGAEKVSVELWDNIAEELTPRRQVSWWRSQMLETLFPLLQQWL